MDRVRCKPWGLDGGLSGLGNGVALHRYGAEAETHFANGKALNQTLQAGDAYILRSGGGGGYGSPLERDAAAVAADVAGGYVTRELAESLYGIVLTDEMALDAAATDVCRSKMHAAGLPHDQPISEALIPFPTPAQPQIESRELVPMTEEERTAFAMTCRCCS